MNDAGCDIGCGYGRVGYETRDGDTQYDDWLVQWRIMFHMM